MNTIEFANNRSETDITSLTLDKITGTQTKEVSFSHQTVTIFYKQTKLPGQAS